MYLRLVVRISKVTIQLACALQLASNSLVGLREKRVPYLLSSLQLTCRCTKLSFNFQIMYNLIQCTCFRGYIQYKMLNEKPCKYSYSAIAPSHFVIFIAALFSIASVANLIACCQVVIPLKIRSNTTIVMSISLLKIQLSGNTIPCIHFLY